MFTLRADDEVEIELAEDHHAQATFDLVDRNREHLAPWMPWVAGTVTVADTKAFLTFVRGEYAAGRQLHANLRYRGEHVGAIGLRTNHANRHAEMGYWLSADREGRGIVTRAARALTTAAFTHLGMNRVEIRAGTGNVRSRAIPERLGYAFEGIARQYEQVGDAFLDHAVYSMLNADWPRT